MMASLGPSTSWQYLRMSSTLCGASKNVTSAPILLNSRHLSRASSSPRPARASVRATIRISAPSSLKSMTGGGGEGGGRWMVCEAVRRRGGGGGGYMRQSIGGVGDETSAARLFGSYDAGKRPRRPVLRGQRVQSPSFSKLAGDIRDALVYAAPRLLPPPFSLAYFLSPSASSHRFDISTIHANGQSVLY